MLQLVIHLDMLQQSDAGQKLIAALTHHPNIAPALQQFQADSGLTLPRDVTTLMAAVNLLTPLPRDHAMLAILGTFPDPGLFDTICQMDSSFERAQYQGIDLLDSRGALALLERCLIVAARDQVELAIRIYLGQHPYQANHPTAVASDIYHLEAKHDLWASVEDIEAIIAQHGVHGSLNPFIAGLQAAEAHLDLSPKIRLHLRADFAAADAATATRNLITLTLDQIPLLPPLKALGIRRFSDLLTMRQVGPALELTLELPPAIVDLLLQHYVG